jgi:uncharacterized protein
MEIIIEELGEAGESFDRVYGDGEILLDEEHARLLESPEVHGQAVRKGDKVRVNGTVSALAEVDCDRCLKSIEAPIETAFDVTYVPASVLNEEGAHEVGEDELEFSFYDEPVIDIDELVREQILLALPSRLLCTEECKGLCPVCGANRNEVENCGCERNEIDPRWSALKNLN